MPVAIRPFPDFRSSSAMRALKLKKGMGGRAAKMDAGAEPRHRNGRGHADCGHPAICRIIR